MADLLQGSFLFAEPITAAVGLYDTRCRQVTAGNPNMLVPWVLSAAYAYSYLNDPIISDGLFDDLAIRLARRWDRVSHIHKHLLMREWFPKGSIPLSPESYPQRIVFATIRLLDGEMTS